MKKALALLLALVMALSLFVGCAKTDENPTQTPANDAQADSSTTTPDNTETPDAPADENELEPVTLKLYFPGDEMEGSADVIEAFNKKLADVLPNTTLEVTFVGSYDPYFEQWPLLLAGGEEMDLAWMGWGQNMAQDVEDGNVLPLSDLMNTYAPNLVSEQEIWADDFASCSKDGEVYAIPTIQPSVKEGPYIYFDPSVEAYFDIDAIAEELHTNNKTTEKLFDLLEDGIQGAVDAGALTLGDNSWYINGEIMKFASRGYVCIDSSSQGGTLSNYFIDPESSSNEVFYLYDIPEVQMAADRMAKWAEAGYFTQAQIAGQTQEGALEILAANVANNGSWQGADERGVKTVTGNDGNEKICILANLAAQNYIGTSSFSYATAMVIPYTAKNPERAMMLLNVLHDEVGTVGNDLINLLCYGFEASSDEAAEYGWANYTAVEEDGQLKVDTTVAGDAGSKHSMTNWVICNTYKTMHDGGAMTTIENKSYALDFWKNKYSTFNKCAISYMQPVTTEISAEIDSVEVIFTEYNSQLRMGGGIDLLNECLSKMAASGLDTVKSNLQAQIEAYAG